MKPILKRSFFNDQRSQLHTAEVVIALMILLVLSLTLINVTQDITGPQESASWLKEKGQQVLAAADTAGLLRSAVYLPSSPEREQAIDDLNSFLQASLDRNIIFALSKSEFLNNGSIQETEFLIGSSITFTQSQQATVVIANYFLSGYANSTTIVMRPMIVNLYLMQAFE